MIMMREGLHCSDAWWKMKTEITSCMYAPSTSLLYCFVVTNYKVLRRLRLWVFIYMIDYVGLHCVRSNVGWHIQMRATTVSSFSDLCSFYLICLFAWSWCSFAVSYFFFVSFVFHNQLRYRYCWVENIVDKT